MQNPLLTPDIENKGGTEAGCCPVWRSNHDASLPEAKTIDDPYNWEYLLPGWLSVGIAVSIIAAKQVLDYQATLNPSCEILKKALDGLYPSAVSHFEGVFGAVGIDVVAVLNYGPDYFKNGHNDHHVKLMPKANSDMMWAVVWGIHASWKLCAIFAAIELIPAGILAACGKPVPFTDITIALSIGVIITVFLAWRAGKACEPTRRYESKVYAKTAGMTSCGYTLFPVLGALTVAATIAVGAANADHSIPNLK